MHERLLAFAQEFQLGTDATHTLRDMLDDLIEASLEKGSSVLATPEGEAPEDDTPTTPVDEPTPPSDISLESKDTETPAEENTDELALSDEDELAPGDEVDEVDELVAASNEALPYIVPPTPPMTSPSSDAQEIPQTDELSLDSLEAITAERETAPAEGPTQSSPALLVATAPSRVTTIGTEDTAEAALTESGSYSTSLVDDTASAPLDALEQTSHMAQEIDDTDESTDIRNAKATTLSLRGSEDNIPQSSHPRPIELDMPPLPPEERYELLTTLGMGGMGRVHRVRDWRLKRILAMKILHPNWLRQPEWIHRFIEEAQATAQLQHPGIVPVHDLGQFADGRFYFTMKEIDGRTLSDVIQDVHKAAEAGRWELTESGWSFRRLIDAFHRVCEAVAYAHSFGILHRDLKPENVMVGEHGEVKVVDWGLVKMAQQDWPAPNTETPLASTHSAPSQPHTTQHGEVKGTPAYMSPEQAGGEIDKISAATDVYGLGAIMYEVLSGHSPYTGNDVRTLLFRILSEPPLPPGRMEPGRTYGKMEWKQPTEPKPLEGPMLPFALVRICHKALAREPEDRYEDAGAMAHEIEQWLEGAQKRARAAQLIEEAEILLPSASTLRQQAAKQRDVARERLAKVGKWEGVEKKRREWGEIDAAKSLEWEAWMIELEAEQKLQAALSHARDAEEAHLALVHHYSKLHREAEAERRAYSEVRAARYLRSHAEALPEEHPAHQQSLAYLNGEGAVSLVTDPPGAEVLLYSYVTEDRRAKPVFVRFLGETPLREVRLGMGSYLLVLRKDGYEEARYPVNIERMEHWQGIPPGEAEPMPVKLLPHGSLAANECYIPAGWFWAGGDAEAINTIPRQRLWADPFVMQRYANTNTQIIAFLDDLVAQGKEEEALRYAPRERAGSSEEQGAQIYGRTPTGGFVLRPDTEGDIWYPNYPALMLDWYGAQAYARWFSQKTHKPWRLPAELEWEKAARGVDGRFYPWGDFLDPSWCCMRESRPGRPLPAVIGSYKEDKSPYGVRGMAGNVRDWCLDIFRPMGPRVHNERVQVPVVAQRPDDTIEEDAAHILRVRRGGGWELNDKLCRVAGRDGDNPTNRDYMSGFRLVRSLW